jgi:hypothetical protein
MACSGTWLARGVGMNDTTPPRFRPALPGLLLAPLLLAAAWATWLYASTRRELGSLDGFDHPWYDEEADAELRSRPY